MPQYLYCSTNSKGATVPARDWPNVRFNWLPKSFSPWLMSCRPNWPPSRGLWHWCGAIVIRCRRTPRCWGTGNIRRKEKRTVGKPTDTVKINKGVSSQPCLTPINSGTGKIERDLGWRTGIVRQWCTFAAAGPLLFLCMCHPWDILWYFMQNNCKIYKYTIYIHTIYKYIYTIYKDYLFIYIYYICISCQPDISKSRLMN